MRLRSVLLWVLAIIVLWGCAIVGGILADQYLRSQAAREAGTAPPGTSALLVTISAFDPTFASPRPDETPSGGKHFVLVGLTLANTGDTPLTYDPSAFLLTDDKGNTYKPVPLRSVQGLPTAALAPHQAADGRLVYEIPPDVTARTIVYQPGNVPATSVNLP